MQRWLVNHICMFRCQINTHFCYILWCPSWPLSCFIYWLGEESLGSSSCCITSSIPLQSFLQQLPSISFSGCHAPLILACRKPIAIDTCTIQFFSRSFLTFVLIERTFMLHSSFRMTLCLFYKISTQICPCAKLNALAKYTAIGLWAHWISHLGNSQQDSKCFMPQAMYIKTKFGAFVCFVPFHQNKLLSGLTHKLEQEP